jgi:hypothetical protein
VFVVVANEADFGRWMGWDAAGARSEGSAQTRGYKVMTVAGGKRARGDGLYDIIGRGGAGGGPSVNEADGERPGWTVRDAAKGGAEAGDANSAWQQGKAQTRAGRAGNDCTRCGERVAAVTKMRSEAV